MQSICFHSNLDNTTVCASVAQHQQTARNDRRSKILSSSESKLLFENAKIGCRTLSWCQNRVPSAKTNSTIASFVFRTCLLNQQLKMVHRHHRRPTASTVQTNADRPVSCNITIGICQVLPETRSDAHRSRHCKWLLASQ